MKYFKTVKNGKITDLLKSDRNFTNATEEITRTEYDSLILGIRVLLNGEEIDKVRNEINGDGYYGH